MKYLVLIFLALPASGCTVLVHNRSFPGVTWRWSEEARLEREYRKIDNPAPN